MFYPLSIDNVDGWMNVGDRNDCRVRGGEAGVVQNPLCVGCKRLGDTSIIAGGL